LETLSTFSGTWNIRVFSLRNEKHKWKELETIFGSRICKENLKLIQAHSKNAQNLTSLLEADLQYTFNPNLEKICC
jgi:hypothetical protein